MPGVITHVVWMTQTVAYVRVKGFSVHASQVFFFIFHYIHQCTGFDSRGMRNSPGDRQAWI